MATSPPTTNKKNLPMSFILANVVYYFLRHYNCLLVSIRFNNELIQSSLNVKNQTNYGLGGNYWWRHRVFLLFPIYGRSYALKSKINNSVEIKQN